jgi:protein arginine N-methyltransferase 1
MTHGYSERGYGHMVADHSRVDAYARALEASVRPGCTVLDLGTGTGIFALVAARLGARRVYAVEPSDAIATAARLARANGVADRIEFIQGFSTEVTLPERVDVIVCDLRGMLPHFHGVVASVVDARARLLAPGGTFIPRRDTLRAAPLEAPETWAEHSGPERVLDFDMSAARERSFSRWARGVFEEDQLLAAPATWGELDYRSVTDSDVRGEMEWTALRAGTAHGLAVWFESELAEGVTLSSGPGCDTIYQTALLPWPRPVRLAAGDRVRATLEARLAGDSYIYRWDSEITPRDGEPLRFRQTDFAAEIPGLGPMRKRADSFVPLIGVEGEIDAFVLSAMDGRTSVGGLAGAVMARFPGHFPSWEAAASRVGTLSDRYAR